MKIVVEKIFELEEDFQNIFISKSGIHVRPKYKELRLSSRTINEVYYEDLYIIEPKKYYYIEFTDDYKYDNTIIETEIFSECGIITLVSTDNRLYLYNATMNIQYIQKGMEIGEAYIYG